MRPKHINLKNSPPFFLSNHHLNLAMPRRIKEESEEEWDENEEDTDSEEEEIRPTTIARKVHNLSKSNGSESEVESEYEEGSSESEYEGEPRSKRRKTSSGVNMRVSKLQSSSSRTKEQLTDFYDLNRVFWKISRCFQRNWYLR